MIPASIVSALVEALGPGLIDLIKSAVADDYDQEAERQAMLKMSRAIHEERVRRRIADAASE